jgi:hypothetical protein
MGDLIPFSAAMYMYFAPTGGLEYSSALPGMMNPTSHSSRRVSVSIDHSAEYSRVRVRGRVPNNHGMYVCTTKYTAWNATGHVPPTVLYGRNI